MPDWEGRWKGGRYYREDGKRVFFIEKSRGGVRYTIPLRTGDDLDLAVGELANFLKDPVDYERKRRAPVGADAPVYITTERLNRFFQKARARPGGDHRKNRLRYLTAWSKVGLDLRSDRKRFEAALEDLEGAPRWLVEALNAFGRFLVREGELARWLPLDPRESEHGTRGEQLAYSVEELGEAWARLANARQAIKDVFVLRTRTGMHHTEVEQLYLAKRRDGPLQDKGVWIRRLTGDPHEIVGVIQVMHKSLRKGKPKRHRLSLDAAGFDAALRLVGAKDMPDRWQMRDALLPLLPSNLRHTFITLGGECSRWVEYSGGGVDRARIAQIVGHAAGSTMISENYDKMQIPPMMVLPLGFP